MLDMKEKEKFLKDELRKMGKVAIAFSGGVDSSYLLKMAIDTLGVENVLAVVMNSELFPESEFNKAVDLASDMGAQVLGLEMAEFSDPRIVENVAKSWYYSKKMLYGTIKKHANELGYTHIIDGMIMDDLSDFRPGFKARDEAGVVSLLQKSQIYKKEIRVLAREAGVTNWNKIAWCSVASRFPYGTKLSRDTVEKIFKAEDFLRQDLGFATVRTRIHGDLVRIEINSEDFLRMWNLKDEINQKIKEIGFNYVTIDLQEFRSGHMNDVLTDEDKASINEAD